MTRVERCIWVLTLDPLARGPGLVGVLTFVLVLAAVALGALWLARRLSRSEREPPESDGPRIALGEPLQRRRRSPIFYDDLKRRETALEDFEPSGPDRHRRNVVKWRGRRQPPKGGRE